MADKVSDSSANYVLLTRLADEFAARYRSGERPPLQEYIDRHPELADDIRALFPALVEIEQVREDHQEAAEHEAAPPAPALEQLGDFRILREVGKGGMGIVYEAEQVSLGRHVALKVLPKTMLLDTRAKRRFEREAKSAARLHHTNIVPVFGVGEQDGLPYYVMQFIQGQGLDAVLEELKRLQLGRTKTGTFMGGELRVSRNVEQVAKLPGEERQDGSLPHGEPTATYVARSLLMGEFEQTTDGQNKDNVDGRPVVPAVEEGPLETAEKASRTHVTQPSSSDSFKLSSSSVVLLGPGREGSKSRHRKPSYAQSVASIGVQVAEALEYAHKQGVLHRDIKPSNLLLDTQGTVWVADFGLAKSDDQQDLTHTGDILGTLRYMPPEAFEGKTDARSDVYALGLTLYELLAFRPAFDEKERNRLIKQVTNAEPARLGKLNRAVPRDLETIIHKAIDRVPGRRYQRAADLSADLQRFLDDEPIQARRVSSAERLWRWCRRSPALAGLIAAVLLLFAAGFAGVSWNYRQAESARRELEGTLYFQRIALAHRELSADNLGRALELLDLCPEPLRQWEWRYLKRLCRVEPVVLRDVGKAEITSIAFGPDGLLLASAGGDGTLKLWNTKTGALIRTVPTGADFVYSVAFQPDGKHLASADAGGKLKVWDLSTGREVFEEDGYLGMHYPYGTGYGVAFSPDGRRLAAGKDGAVNVWDWNKHRLLHSLPGHEKRSISVAFSLDGQRLASGGWGGSLMIWDVETGKCLHTLTEHQDPISSLAFSPDGLRLASACFDRRLTVWHTTTGRQVESWRGQEGLVLGAAFSPDGLRLASCGEDRTVRLWEATTGREVLKLRGHDAMSLCVAFSPDGQRLASCSSDGTIWLWNAASLRGDETEEVLTLSQPSGEVWSLAVSPDGRRVATSGQARPNLRNVPVYVWDLTTGRIDLEFAGHPSVVFSVGWHPDGGQLASSSGWDDERKAHVVKVWDTRTGRTAYVLPREGENFAVAFSPDGRHLVTGGAGRVVDVWEAATGREVGTLGAHDRQIRGLTFSRDGRRLASASSDGIVKVWDAARLAEHQEPLAVLRTRTAWEILNIAFSPDGDRLVTGGAENTVKVWDLTTGQEVQSLSGHSGEVCTATFSPDPEGRWIASGGEDSTVKVWDSQTGKLLRNFRGHTGLVTWVAFTPDGRRLLSASRDGTVRVWDLSHLSRNPTGP
jgi:WD40 repeat protein/serine/threonine protein kinase